MTNNNGSPMELDQESSTNGLRPSDSTSFTYSASTHTKGVGTASYCAPEQLSGHEYDQQVDMYALGMMAIEMFMKLDTGMVRWVCSNARVPIFHYSCARIVLQDQGTLLHLHEYYTSRKMYLEAHMSTPYHVYVYVYCSTTFGNQLWHRNVNQLQTSEV